jgi:hypothetical protein
MILRFKKDSKAELTVKELIENRNKTEEHAKSIIEKITGIRPVAFGYGFFFGMSYSWSCKSTAFDMSVPDKIEGMTFVSKHDGMKVFKPNARTKKGKEIAETFQNEQTRLRTDSTPMNEFGIYCAKELKYTNFNIGEDESGVWMAISNSTYEWLEPHPDVFLETKIQTVSENAN